MKTFTITTYPIVAGIAVPCSNTIRAISEIRAIKLASKKHLRFGICEVCFDASGNRLIKDTKEYINNNGLLEPKK